jgi:release factor glutamine methyltransferase
MEINQEIQWLLQDKYNGIKNAEFENDIERLQSGEPLAYIIGWQPFCGVKIFLDSYPLIPRPETEYLINNIIKELSDKQNLKILDLCAGSGCIGVALLKALLTSTVDFGELDKSHHATILKNITENGIDTNRARIYGGDLFENITDTYDIIVTNPPYINPELSDRIGENVLKFEPELALLGGKDGMQIITKIAQKAPNFLKSEGILWIEHEPEQVKEIKQLLPQSEVIQDQFEVDRFTKYIH